MKITRRHIRVLLLVLGAGLLGVVWFGFYLFSPRRDAEIALNLRWLPFSVKNLHVSVDAWTDYVVRGYCEISPKDFERLIAARDYCKSEVTPRTSDGDFLPIGKSVVVTTTYLWGDGTSNSFIETNAARDRVVFTYSAD